MPSKRPRQIPARIRLKPARLRLKPATAKDAAAIAALTLTKRKPWAIDASYFTECKRPLHLVGIAVAPRSQRRGIGRLCMNEAKRLGRAWPGDAIRLDAFDAVAGAGEFYRKCGFREVGRATYRKTPLVYFELML